MTTYFEYGVNLTDNQKRSLATAINNRAPLTLRLKHSNLSGNDELMLTKTQLKRIQKSLANGTGADIKISKTQIRKVAKQGGSLFTTLASLGARVLPYAVKGLSKAVPALATGAVSALGSMGIDKIFGKGINIPKKFFPMLPYIVNELTSSQIDQINKTMQTGGRLVIKPTRKQHPNHWKYFVNKPLSNFDLEKWIDDLGIKHFRSIYSRDRLPDQIRKKECGIINLDSIEGEGTHWVCYRNIDKQMVEYFDPFGLIMPHEIHHYLATSGKEVIYSQDEIQNRDTVLCGYWCLYYLIERQKGKSILEVIHHEDFDHDNSDFIQDCFINRRFLD